MRNITTKILGFITLLLSFSCGQTPFESNKDEQVFNAAVDTKADAEFSPSDDDLKCFHDYECEAADQGCCFHEKRMAINRDKYPAARIKIRAQCKALTQDFLEEQSNIEQEQKKDLEKGDFKKARFGRRVSKFLCKAAGRDSGTSSSLNEKVECKKDLPRPQLRDRAKDPQKYDADEKTYNSTPGKCAFKS